MTQTVVIGLGVSGLACALKLQEQGWPFCAFEQESIVGGLARSERMRGFIFDYGPHILLQVPELIQRLNLELDECVCESTIFPNLNAILTVPAPIQHNLHLLPFPERVKIFGDIVQRNLKRQTNPSKTFQQHLIAQSGATLFNLFFRDYELKRMRFPLADVDASMPNRIQPPSLAYLFGQGAASKQGVCGGNDTRFKYPRTGGIDALPQAMAGLLPQQQIRLQHSLSEIDLHKKRVMFTNGCSEYFTSLVLSLPLPEVINRIKNPPQEVLEAAEQLIYSSLYVMNIGLDSPFIPSWAIARIPKNDICFYRVSIPSNYSKANVPDGGSILTVEVAHHEQRYPLSKMEVRKLIYADLVRLGLLASPEQVVIEWLHNIRYGHIVYNAKTREALKTIFSHLHRHGVFCCGKYGEWRDMLMPNSIQSGLDAAEKVISRQL